MTTPDAAAAWAERYFLAWATNDPALVASLFSEDAVYYYGPFRPPSRGRDAIVQRWTENANQTNVASQFEVIAVSGDTAVIHWTVSFDHPAGHTTMDGVLIVTFDEYGACREHREWYSERTVGGGGEGSGIFTREQCRESICQS